MAKMYNSNGKYVQQQWQTYAAAMANMCNSNVQQQGQRCAAAMANMCSSNGNSNDRVCAAAMANMYIATLCCMLWLPALQPSLYANCMRPSTNRLGVQQCCHQPAHLKAFPSNCKGGLCQLELTFCSLSSAMHLPFLHSYPMHPRPP